MAEVNQKMKYLKYNNHLLAFWCDKTKTIGYYYIFNNDCGGSIAGFDNVFLDYLS